jgi:hypothetical protein
MVILLDDNRGNDGGDKTEVTAFNAFFLTFHLYFLAA